VISVTPMDVEVVAARIAKSILSPAVVDGENRWWESHGRRCIRCHRSGSTETSTGFPRWSPSMRNIFKRRWQSSSGNRVVWRAIRSLRLLSTSSWKECEAIKQMVALSFFIPLVVGTCGNAGTQSATVVVRSLALGDVSPSDYLRVFWRELLMGAALGLALGVMAYFRVFLQDRNMMLGLIVASALLTTLLAANLAGALIPLLLKKLRLDPALTAGPFIATIIDALGITIYFQVAVYIMRTF